VPDAAYEAAREQFDEGELVKLTLLVNAINAWNRFAIGFRLMHPTKRTAAQPSAVAR